MSRKFFAALLVAAGLAVATPSAAAPEGIHPRVYLDYPEVVQLADSHARLAEAAAFTADSVGVLTALRREGGRLDVCDGGWKPQDEATYALLVDVAATSLITAKDVLEALRMLPAPSIPEGAEGHSQVGELYEDALSHGRNAATNLEVLAIELGALAEPDLAVVAQQALDAVDDQAPASAVKLCACTDSLGNSLGSCWDEAGDCGMLTGCCKNLWTKSLIRK